MCGIGAIINVEKVNEELITLMQTARHRGENFHEHILIGKNGLSCNRLKIVDRDNGKQPIGNENCTIYAVLNGEIYNFKNLRRKLISLGHVFKTETDTEVLVHGYEEWEEDLPKQLDGQFAFVVLDSKKNNFLAARDHFGIKPLFYAAIKDRYYFSSEAKQLTGFVDTIHEVPPGTMVTEKGPKNYYSLPINNSKPDADKVLNLLDAAVKRRVQTDLPIAVFLSGGVDSTAVLALARKHHNNVTAICLGKEWRNEQSDMFFARRYCEDNNIPLIRLNVPSEEELFSLIPKMVKITESFEPNVIKQSGLSYAIAALAARYGFKIVLCGEGADELFCGYPEFVNQTVNNANYLSREFFKNLYRTQLLRVDRTAMAHTVEVRVPFMDKSLVEYSLNISSKYKIQGNSTKKILRESLQNILPEYIRNRRKVVLSEGMGHKGNSLKDGLFTSLAQKKISLSEVKKYKKEYPEHNFTTQEEVFYFKYYLEYRYTKILYRDRPVANKSNSAK